MHPPARQTAQKGPDSSPMDLALHASDILLASTQIQQHQNQNHDPQSDMDMEPSLCEQPQQDDDDDTLPPPAPLMHFPHCRLEITTFPTPNGPGKLEQIALPGALVRTLLSRFESDLQQQQEEEYQYQQQRQQHRSTSRTPSPPPSSAASSASKPTAAHSQPPSLSPPTLKAIRIQPHFDDAAEWVFSRCLLADFTGFREDEAEALSTAAGAGRLCCWASVVLSPPRRRRAGRAGRVGRAGRAGGVGMGVEMGMGVGMGVDEEDEDEDLEDDYEGEDELEGLEEEEGLAGEGGEEGEGRWELEFVVQRVGVRDPGSGWCECF